MYVPNKNNKAVNYTGFYVPPSEAIAQVFFEFESNQREELESLLSYTNEIKVSSTRLGTVVDESEIHLNFIRLWFVKFAEFFF